MSTEIPAVLVGRTAPEWVEIAGSDLAAVLNDHAHCEKKAAATALSLIQNYPHHPGLVRKMVRLAHEEMKHFEPVHSFIVKRGYEMVWDRGDPYARALMALVRKDSDTHKLVDRLLVASLIEARSCERLALLGEGLDDNELAPFYRGLAKAEAGHHRLFVDLAYEYAPKEEVDARLRELAEVEGALIQEAPIRARIH